jgi:hypothetical protein
MFARKDARLADVKAQWPEKRTGRSMVESARVLVEFGCSVVCAVVVDREEGAREAFAAMDVPFKSLATITQVLGEPDGPFAPGEPRPPDWE